MKNIKKILFTIAVLFLSICRIFASDILGENSLGYDRTEENNYGVNKKWIITDSNKYDVLSTPYVDASQKIYDYSDILTEEEEKEIKELIDEYIRTTNMDMVLVTIDMEGYTSDGAYDNYAANFYDYNDFGLNIEDYSGVLLLRDSNQYNPYYNVYMFGKAQLYYDFERSEEMLDAIYSSFVNKNYLSGYKQFINMYTNYYNQGIPESNSNVSLDENGMMYIKYEPPIMLAILISTIVTVIVGVILVKKNKMIKKATHAHDYLNRNSIKYYKDSKILVSTNTTRHYNPPSSSSSGGGGGGGSIRGSSGGGHSSGGGRRG